jgi:type II secretory pathway pseudopilin PulG
MIKKEPSLPKIWQTSGMTLLEVLISVCIIGLIAGPFLSMFVFSNRHNRQAASHLEASFVAQSRIENLQTMDYLSVVREGRNQRIYHNGYYIATHCVPYSPGTPDVFHVILQGEDSASGCEFYVIPPSGHDYIQITQVDSAITLDLDVMDNEYTLSLATPKNHQSLTGPLSVQGSGVAVFINMTQYNKDHPIVFNTGLGGTKVDIIVYDTSFNGDRITVVPDNERRYSGFIYRTHSMARVKVEVYGTREDTRPEVMIQSILELEN